MWKKRHPDFQGHPPSNAILDRFFWELSEQFLNCLPLHLSSHPSLCSDWKHCLYWHWLLANSSTTESPPASQHSDLPKMQNHSPLPLAQILPCLLTTIGFKFTVLSLLLRPWTDKVSLICLKENLHFQVCIPRASPALSLLLSLALMHYFESCANKCHDCPNFACFQRKKTKLAFLFPKLIIYLFFIRCRSKCLKLHT